jgi:two-component system NarL family response regulator
VNGDGAGASRLAPRERQVLRLVAEGKRNNEIALLLHIAASTVEVHRRNIMRKLEIKTVAELARYAAREGIVSP